MGTNTIKRMNRLSDFEIPEDWPYFPSHAQMREWLESYVDHFDFRSRIHLEHEVVKAEALSPKGWRVEVRRPDGSTEAREYDALMAASGYIWSPKLPAVPGEFAGEIIHAQAYRDPKTPIDLTGKSIVVVGIGNTGCEIVCEIAEAGAGSVYLSARGGTWILPKWAGEEPAAAAAPMAHQDEPVIAPLSWLPASWRQPAFAKLVSIVLRRSAGERMRRFEELGLPRAPANPLAQRPTVNDGLLELLESGRISARPALAGFDGDSVRFADGRVERADVVICATGYNMTYPYLDEALVKPGTGDLHLFQGTMHPERHDLFFVGVSQPMGAIWPMAEVHSRFVAALLTGRYALPAAKRIEKDARWILSRPFGSPAILGESARLELARGARRAERTAS